MKKLALALALALTSAAAIAAGLSASLTWTAPTANTDGTPITAALTYNVYQGAKGAETQAATGLTTPAATVTTGLAAGSTVCFQVTAVAGGQESARSAEACKTFPASVPAAPAALAVQ